MLQPFRKLKTDSQDVDRMQDTLLAVLNPITQDRLLNRMEYEAIINTTNTVIPHTLGYIPKGWIVSDMNAFADIKRVSWDKNAITLIATAQVTIKFLLF